MLPIILLTLVLMWQMVLIGYAYVLAGNAADEGARAAVVTDGWEREGACRAAALADMSAAWRDGAAVDCAAGSTGEVLRTSVRMNVPVLFPGFANFPFHVTGAAGAALEEK